MLYSYQIDMFAISKDICKKILCNFYTIDYNTFIDEDMQYNVYAIDFNQTVGFLGKHSRLKIEYKSKIIDAFVKVPSDGLNEKIGEVSIADNFGVMKIEILFYEEMLVQLESKSKSKAYQFCPKYFYSSLKDEILILEDVSKLGFYMINKYQGFDYEQSVAVLKTLAQFHATSFRLDEDTLQDFDRKINQHKKIGGQFLKKWTESSIESLKALAQLIPVIEHESFSQKLKSICETDHQKVYNNRKYCRLLNHGDLWSNNILINNCSSSVNKYQVILVDFQLIRYVPPVLDLLKFYLISINSHTKKEYTLQHFLDIYYNELEKLKLLNSNLSSFDKMFPRDQLHDSSFVFWQSGLLDAAMSATIVLLNESSYAKFLTEVGGFQRFMMTSARKDIVTETFLSDENFRVLMTDLLVAIANS